MSFPQSVLKVFNLFRTLNLPVVAGVDADGIPRPMRVSADGTQVGAIPGLAIPAHDHVAVSYVGVTNNISTVVYKTGGSGGTAVATLTFTYVGGTPSSDDANIASVTKS